MSKLTKALTASAGNAGGDKLYVEDVFSTYVYTGNGSARTITNGIDLAGEGGLNWSKRRDASSNHVLTDTARGTGKTLYIDDNTQEQNFGANGVSAFNSNGYDLGSGFSEWNNNTSTYVSWTFRKAKKFFDVVTYTGNGVVGRKVTHALGSVPGMFVVRRLDAGNDFVAYHRSLGNGEQIWLTSTSKSTTAGTWDNTDPTSTEITLANGADVNIINGTYVVYLFAHDAGGFGAGGGESIIKCGSYTGNGSPNGPEINLGWEPQFIIVKNATTNEFWWMLDTMRGFSQSTDRELYPNLLLQEGSGLSYATPTATGFKIQTAAAHANGSGSKLIYIAIRMGPMKVPELASEVFSAAYDSAANLNNTPADTFGSILTDLIIISDNAANGNKWWADRLRGTGLLFSTDTSPEALGAGIEWDKESGVGLTGMAGGTPPVSTYNFKRAPGFMDVVCYTGTGGLHVVAHNLGALPEMVIIKARSANGIDWWACYSFEGTYISRLRLNTDGIAYEMLKTEVQQVMSGDVTSSTFQVGTNSGSNGSGTTYVAYLFVTLAGISKVGSYTGNAGSAVNVDCGFSNGARFILIKRTDASGDWYVWDSARGITAGNDPYILLNDLAVEVTNTNYVDALAAGFTVTSTAPIALNATGGNYIFLAIA